MFLIVFKSKTVPEKLILWDFKLSRLKNQSFCVSKKFETSIENIYFKWYKARSNTKNKLRKKCDNKNKKTSLCKKTKK